MIKLGAWNIRGLNDPLKQKEVRSLILVNNFSLMGVVETKIMIVDVVLLDSKMNFLLSIVYGCNRSSDRRVLWSDMRAVYHGFGDRPWIQLGDFNTVRLASERLVGFDVNSADEFNECLTDLSQDDLPSKGFWFTWTNKRSGSGDNKSRIDRHPEFEHILSSSWTNLVVGRPMFVLAAKLKRLKGVLKHLNLRCYSNISTRVMEARDQMIAIQQLFFATPFDVALCIQDKELVCTYINLRNAEESFMKQRSRVKWLALGDQNSSFFHQKMCAHRARNTIQSLHTIEGVFIKDSEAIKEEILLYYVSLLVLLFSSKVDASFQLQQAIQSRVPMDVVDQLISPMSVIEIKKALWSINGDKAPGPDGYNSLFYQQNWGVVGQDLVQAVTYFFEHGYMLKELNATAISLIPKVHSPSTIKDYRPISCCNVSYKCITKVLANHFAICSPFPYK
ncbi:uncharacterized protein LOC131298595 [Rhododendron vialii]|uniref:uncharacterized protein LOC131298595 n=1 Tax=Rhododendron vialii TaxID=182163 RepID=UPI00265E07C0|nr:uncharacterized protein LOC131298595 [Rhododendron vialii]